jgi:gamma-glutamyltranspeptidase / glutathione hydrolase
MLAAAHAKHGRLAWAALFEPAIALAEGGFSVSRRLNLLLTWQGTSYFSPAARDYFFDRAGVARPVGHVLKNPDYAKTLKDLAARGADSFYQGRIAEDIVAAVAAAADNPGDMTVADLAAYAAKSRDALCVAYRSKRICGMGPPSSGMTAVGQILKLIEPLPGFAPGQPRMSAEALHALAEAQKLAYADRGRYIADPDFVAVPAGLLDDDYLADRRRLIRMDQPMARPEAGGPPGVDRRAFGRDTTREATGTSHLSIVDGDGNAVSMTTTIESAFGSGLWAAGFLLNNELTDFALRPADASGVAAANRVDGGKRPRSSMAPTMVFDDQGRLEIVTGSPGGPRIIQYVAKTLVAMIDWDMDAQSAAELINFGSSGGTFDIEMGWPGYGVSSLWPALQMKGLGHRVATRLMTSGVHTVARRGGRLEGGADPRREGVALGDE